MFWHNFKYTLKTIGKNKSLIFWTFAFPIILGTLFSVAFSDIESNEQLNTISIALVNTEENNQVDNIIQTFQSLMHQDEKMFDVSVVSENEAIDLLEKKEITGYVLLGESPTVQVNRSGINETILASVTETIYENVKMASILIEKKILDATQQELASDFNTQLTQIQSEVEELLAQENSFVVDESSNHMSYTMIEFYTLIAMTALYGGILGMVAVNKCLPNMSHTGKRISVSPTKKGHVILGSVVASYFIQLIGLALLFLYTIFVLHVDYGSDIFFVVVLSLIGALAGLSLGILVSSTIKTSENAKTGILLAITMFGCFLSGMMGITMKYVIDSNIPILNQINPASMITDGLYALYYYEGKIRYYENLFSLLLFSLLCILLSISFLRRQKYDSI